jgi:predicted RNA methylase
MTKKNLAVELSKFYCFDDAKQKLEQYSTDSEIAATMLWAAHMQEWIEGKYIVDFGAGTGILGIGCLLMGARKVVFVEKDKDAIVLLRKNIKKLTEEYEIHAEIRIEHKDINEIFPSELGKVDLVIQNPPFGTKEKNVDALFLSKAMALSDKVITMHKTVTKSFIRSLAYSNNFSEFRCFDFDYPLKMTLPQHKKKIEYIKVSCWFLEKK